MATPYTIPAEAIIEETVVNRSRFICYVFPCDSSESAKQFIKQVQLEHPQCSHHCYAFITDRPEYSQGYGFSDDGEPSGTAGKPMLAVLQGSGIGEICAVTARYFGGTKLGTGGLQRAYGDSVRQALLCLPTKIKIPMVHKRLACQYTQVNDVLHALNLHGGEVINQEYTEAVLLTLALPEEKILQFSEQLKVLSSGKLVLTALK